MLKIGEQSFQAKVKQHTLSNFYLQQWRNEGDCIYCLMRRNENIIRLKKDTSSVAAQKNFYKVVITPNVYKVIHYIYKDTIVYDFFIQGKSQFDLLCFLNIFPSLYNFEDDDKRSDFIKLKEIAENNYIEDSYSRIEKQISQQFKLLNSFVDKAFHIDKSDSKNFFEGLKKDRDFFDGILAWFIVQGLRCEESKNRFLKEIENRDSICKALTSEEKNSVAILMMFFEIFVWMQDMNKKRLRLDMGINNTNTDFITSNSPILNKSLGENIFLETPLHPKIWAKLGECNDKDSGHYIAVSEISNVLEVRELNKLIKSMSPDYLFATTEKQLKEI